MKALLDYFKNFQILTKDEEEAILNIATLITLPRNKDLQPIGHTCKTIYFIKHVIARIYYFKDGIDIT